MCDLPSIVSASTRRSMPFMQRWHLQDSSLQSHIHDVLLPIHEHILLLNSENVLHRFFYLQTLLLQRPPLSSAFMSYVICSRTSPDMFWPLSWMMWSSCVPNELVCKSLLLVTVTFGVVNTTSINSLCTDVRAMHSQIDILYRRLDILIKVK